jgi:hypothetical protein
LPLGVPISAPGASSVVVVVVRSDNDSSKCPNNRRLPSTMTLDAFCPEWTEPPTTEDAPGAEIGTPSGGEGDEKKREKREMRTLSLIAGVGTTAKHAKNGNAAVGDRHTRGTTSPTRRRTSVGQTCWQSQPHWQKLRKVPAADPEARPFDLISLQKTSHLMYWKEKLGSVMGVSAPT